MNTSFGRFLEKDSFKKIFLISSLIGSAICAAMNAHSVWFVFHHSLFACIVGVIYLVMGIISLMQQKIAEKWQSRRFETAIGVYCCFFIYDLVLLILWLIVSLAFSLSDRVQAIGSLSIGIFSIIIVMLGYMHARKVRYTSYSIDLSMGGSPYRIAMLSDIHLGVFVDEAHVHRIVRQVNQVKPDLVVICGDIIDVNNHILNDKAALDKISVTFRSISAKEGVYAVLGNHDPSIENEVFGEFLRDSNIQLLHNKSVRLSRLNLIGRSDASNNERNPIDSYQDTIDHSVPVVVLDHNPSGIREAVKLDADLVLSGHTHKGQFFPVTYFTKLANGKHYFYGHEIFGKTHAVISSGAGYFQLPVRIGTSNEVVEILIS